MPSLRRIHSSPSVRASPYPSSLSSSSAISSYVAVAPRLGPRRTASDSYRRRVLADIEWWRVLDGQHVQGQESVPQLDQAQVPQLGTDDVEPSSGVVEQARTELLTPSTPVIQPAPVTDASEVSLVFSPQLLFTSRINPAFSFSLSFFHNTSVIANNVPIFGVVYFSHTFVDTASFAT